MFSALHKNRSKLGLLGAGLALAMMATGPSTARDIVERTQTADGGQRVVDWGDSFLEVTGRATANPERSRVRMRLKSLAAARLLAQSQLLEIIKGVEITSGVRVEDFILTDQRAAARVRGTLKNAYVVNEEITWNEYPDGTAEPEAAVTMRVCFRDNAPACRGGGSGRGLLRSMGKELLQGAGDRGEDFTPDAGQAEAAQADIADDNANYQSLIIVIEGIPFDPVLSPQVVTEGGEVVYAVDKIDPNAFFANGAVQYANSVDNARAIELITDDPLVVKASSVDAEGRIVLTAEEAAKVMSASTAAENFLGAARVALVLQ